VRSGRRADLRALDFGSAKFLFQFVVTTSLCEHRRAVVSAVFLEGSLTRSGSLRRDQVSARTVIGRWRPSRNSTFDESSVGRPIPAGDSAATLLLVLLVFARTRWSCAVLDGRRCRGISVASWISWRRSPSSWLWGLPFLSQDGKPVRWPTSLKVAAANRTRLLFRRSGDADRMLRIRLGVLAAVEYGEDAAAQYAGTIDWS